MQKILTFHPTIEITTKQFYQQISSILLKNVLLLVIQKFWYFPKILFEIQYWNWFSVLFIKNVLSTNILSHSIEEVFQMKYSLNYLIIFSFLLKLNQRIEMFW